MAIAYYAYLAAIAIDFIGIGALKPLPLPMIVLLSVYVALKYPVQQFLAAPQSKLLLVFTVLTALAVVHGFVRTYAIEHLKTQVGCMLLTFVGFFLLSSERRLKVLMGTLVALMVYLSALNFDKFLSARVGSFTAGFFLGDGNDFGWALNIVLPFALYLFIETKSVWRYAFLAAALLLGFAIIGTQSRGASLALAAGIVYLWWFVSSKRLRSLVIIAILGIGVWTMAPQSYTQRMESISDYQSDSSANNRIYAWGRAFDMALDNPVLGVGAGSFNSVYGRYYRGEDGPTRWISTHSIYFKVLAEYGFTGIIILLWILVASFFCNLRVRKLIEANRDRVTVSPRLPDMLNMSLVAYSVAGAFLSGYTYPHFYILMALILATQMVVNQQLAATTLTPSVQGDSRGTLRPRLGWVGYGRPIKKPPAAG